MAPGAFRVVFGTGCCGNKITEFHRPTSTRSPMCAPIAALAALNSRSPFPSRTIWRSRWRADSFRYFVAGPRLIYAALLDICITQLAPENSDLPNSPPVAASLSRYRYRSGTGGPTRNIWALTFSSISRHLKHVPTLTWRPTIRAIVNPPNGNGGSGERGRGDI